MIRIIILIGVMVMGSANAEQKVCSLNISKLLEEVVTNARFDEQIPLELMSIKEFFALKVCAPVRWEEYLSHLPSTSKHEAEVLIYAAQSLKGKAHLDFGEGIIALSNDSQRTTEWLSLFVFPGFDWNTELVENYGDPRVIVFLKQAKEILANHKDDIDEIISGRRLELLINSRLNKRAPLNSL